MKDMFRAQQKAKKIKKQLAAIQIEAEENGVKVVISADQKIISIEIADELCAVERKAELQKSILKAFEKANKKAQEIAAENMKEMMGDLPF